MNLRDMLISVNGIPCVPGGWDDDPPPPTYLDDLAVPWAPRSWPRESAACLQMQIEDVGLAEQHITDAGLARLPEIKRGDKVQVDAGRVSLVGTVVALVLRPPAIAPFTR